MKTAILNEKRIVNIIMLIIFTILLFQPSSYAQITDSFRFVFMTDIHVQPELKADEGFKQAIAKVNELLPDFVITGGDLIMDALGQSFERSTMLYDMYNEICNDFTMPVYNTIGNHEVFGLYEKSSISPDHPEYGKEMYKQRIGHGKTYYSFDHNGWHFIVLDAIGFTPERKYIGEIDSSQIVWLKDDLSKTDNATPIVVSTHIPFISVGEQMLKGGAAAFSPAAIIANSNDIIALFHEHNLKLVLQGHLHIVEDIHIAGVHYITGGAVSGKWWEGARDGFPEGFVVIDVNGDSFAWSYETYGWQAVAENESEKK
ncbi:metallophosphoesterase [candidate division KSB1 bacterium]|nr:metallophosphoesterase [candidate division KSB1 bacterium]